MQSTLTRILITLSISLLIATPARSAVPPDQTTDTTDAAGQAIVRRLVDAANRIPDPATRARLLADATREQARSRQAELARPIFSAAIDAAQLVVRPDERTIALLRLADIKSTSVGEMRSAIEKLEDTARAGIDPQEQRAARAELAKTRRGLKEAIEDAKRPLALAEAAARTIPDPYFRAASLRDVAEAARTLPDWSRAQSALAWASRAVAQLRYLGEQVYFLVNLVDVAIRVAEGEIAAEQWSDARKAYDLARDIGEQIPYREQGAMKLRDVVLGQASLVIDELDAGEDRAAADLADARRTLARLDRPEHRSLALVRVAEAELELGNEAESRRLFNEAAAAARQVIPDGPKAAAMTTVAQRQAESGFDDDARRWIATVSEPALQANLYLALAEVVFGRSQAGREEELNPLRLPTERRPPLPAPPPPRSNRPSAGA